MSDDIEALWDEVRTLRGTAAIASRQSMLNRLGAGPTPAAVSTAQINWPGGSELNTGANTLGNVRPFIGQTNLLPDTTFETPVMDVGDAVSLPATTGLWTGASTVASGSVTGVEFGRLALRTDTTGNNPFNTDLMSLAVNFVAGAANIDVYLYPSTDITPIAAPTLPYLVAALRVQAALLGIGDPVAVLEATMQLYDVDHAVVVAETDPPLDVFSLGPDDSFLLFAAYQAANANELRLGTWRWRLKLHAEKASTGFTTTGGFTIGEPQLHFSYTPDPLPFQPAIASWLPRPRPLAPGTPTALTSAGQSLAVSPGTLVYPVNTGGATVTLTSTPTIAAGTDGQEILLVFTGTSGTLTIQDQGTLAGSTLRLTAVTATLGPRDNMRLLYVSGTGWVQCSPIVSVL